MPYTKEELENLEFYQELARRDEAKYSNKITYGWKVADKQS